MCKEKEPCGNSLSIVKKRKKTTIQQRDEKVKETNDQRNGSLAGRLIQCSERLKSYTSPVHKMKEHGNRLSGKWEDNSERKFTHCGW